MKRILLFLGVFLLGAALIWMASAKEQRRQARSARSPLGDLEAEVEPSSQPAGGRPRPDETRPADTRPDDTKPTGVERPDAERVELPPAPPGQEPLFFHIRGQQSFDLYGESRGATRPRKLHVEGRFEPLDAAYRRYRVTEIQTEQFDEASGELVNAIRADAAQLELEGASRDNVALANDGRLALEGVTIERRRDHELAPLVLRAPAIDAVLETQHFASVGDGEVQVEGRGLSARGTGLVYDGLAGALDLERGGEVTLERGEEGTARLSTPRGGPLRIRRTAETGQIEIRAEDGARIVLEDPDGTAPDSVVDADAITVQGHVNDRDELIVEGVQAFGRVVAVRGDERYSGVGAELVADAAGHIRHIVLDSEPSARLAVLAPDGTRVPILASGAGPLAVDLDLERGNFRLQGPAEIRQEEGTLRLSAAGSIAGAIQADESLTAELRDDVRVEEGLRRLETQALDAYFLSGEPGTVRLVGAGPTRMSGPDTHGRTLSIDVDGESEVLSVGSAWRVPIARGVLITAVGDEPFRASAGLVRDLVWDTQTLRAEDGVSWVTDFGEGDATRVDVTLVDGERRVQLAGAETPARFRVLPARLDPEAETDVEAADFAALEIELRPDSLDARGDVHATVDGLEEDYDLAASQARLDLLPVADPAAVTGTRDFVLTALDVERLQLASEGEQTDIESGELRIEGTLQRDETRSSLSTTRVVADSGVTVDHRGDVRVRLTGERFVREAGQAIMEPLPGERLVVSGLLPDSNLPFRLEADDYSFDGATLRAERPTLGLTAPLKDGGGRMIAGPASMAADRLRFDREGLVLEGAARLIASDPEGIVLRVRADRMVLAGELDDSGKPGEWKGELASFTAEGQFAAVYGGLGIAHGERLVFGRDRLVLEGVEGRPASIEGQGFSFDTRRFAVDLDTFLIESDRGVLRGIDSKPPWDLEFAAILPCTVEQGTFFAIVSPRWVSGPQEARCNYVAAWIDADMWRAKGRERLFGEPMTLDAEPEPRAADSDTFLPASDRPDLVPDLFASLGRGDLPKYLQALYFEGALEVIEKGRTGARAESVYLDIPQKRGWMDEAELIARTAVGSSNEAQMRVRSARIRARSDGSLRARRATITTSKFDDPSYVIETDDIVLEPVRDRDDLFRLSARGNRIKFRNGLSLPLPSLGNLALDEEGDVRGFVGQDDERLKTIDYVRAGQMARYGPSIGTAVRYDFGKFGKRVANLLGFDGEHVRGKWYTEGSYLGDRGPLLGLGLEVRERGRNDSDAEDFWFRVYGHGIPDKGEDRGLLRVPEEDRDRFRSWVHGRGRYPFNDHEWIDLAFTHQSDPGMQAEFYQSEFQRYEERDNYLHWRRADGDRYLDASVSMRGDSYRTAVEERPSAGLYRGEHQVGTIGKTPLLHGWGLSVASLNRLEGDLRYEEPFVGSDGLPDGLGDRDVARAHLDQRLSAPFALGYGGLRATPWLRAGATAWDKAVDEEDSASRASLVGGLDLATTLVRDGGDGHLHTLTPKLTYREDIVVEENGGDVVRFDALDDPVEGRELGGGVRALWWSPRKEDHLDLQLEYLRQTERSEELPDRDLVAGLMDWRTHLGTMPFGVLHDGRFDLSSGSTLYARTTVAIQPSDPLILEVSYRRGVDAELHGLFETASLDARWRVDPKWELQIGQDVAVKNGNTLKNNIIVRRFSADFLFEFEVDHRSGEGGTTFGINFAPMFLWRPTSLGILDR